MYTDSELCAKGFGSHHTDCDDSDLWSDVWHHIDAKNLSVAVLWAKSHGIENPQYIIDYCIDFQYRVCNAMADKLADRAAKETALDKAIVHKFIIQYALTQLIKRRLLQIVKSFILKALVTLPLGPSCPTPVPR